MSDTFSKRLGYDKRAHILICEDAPQKLRVGIWNLIEDYVNRSALPDSASLYNQITSYFCLVRSGANYSYEIKHMILQTFKWFEIFDLVEFLFATVQCYDYDQVENMWCVFPERVSEARYLYTKDINKILYRENIGWRLRKGKLEKSGSEILDKEVIERTRKLLVNPDYAGPNHQFNKAIEFFSKRPKPDLENCIKEAVCALEGLSRILLKNKNITLGEATNLMVGKKIIRKPLDKTFHALYGFVSTEPGPRHGAHILSSIDMAETEFVLYNSAVCMLFLADKFGVSAVQEVPVEPFPPSDEEGPGFPSEAEPPDFPPDDEIPNSPTEEEPPDFPDDENEVPF